MSFILPDELLTKLNCSTCGKYLSVKPIKIYPNGVIKCGRCSVHEADNGVISFYGKVVDCGLFPCINRYEGCNVYLTYSDILEHENKCFSGLYDCPLCPPDIHQSASAYHFLKHYQKSHPDEILNSSEFCIDINSECDKSFLYCKNNYLYIIYARRYINEKYLHLNASNIGRVERCKKITQKIKIYTLDRKLLVETKSQPCSSLDNNSDAFKIPLSKLIYFKSNMVFCSFNLDTSDNDNFILLPNNVFTSSEKNDTIKGLHNVYPEIYLSPEFRKVYPNFYLSPCKTKIIEKSSGDNKTKIEFPRICNFCENIFQISAETNNIFKCTKNHFMCDSCFRYDTVCCDGPCSYAERESEIYMMLYFYCKWKCHRFYCGQDLRYHETRCRNNEEIYLNQEQIGKKYFGKDYTMSNNCLTKTTNVFHLNEIAFESISKIFVITRDNFKFILNCLKEKNNLRFWFSHQYAHDEHYLLVRIKERHLPVYTRVNSFSLDANNRNILFFSVVLRKT